MMHFDCHVNQAVNALHIHILTGVSVSNCNKLFYTCICLLSYLNRYGFFWNVIAIGTIRNNHFVTDRNKEIIKNSPFQGYQLIPL